MPARAPPPTTAAPSSLATLLVVSTACARAEAGCAGRARACATRAAASEPLAWRVTEARRRRLGRPWRDRVTIKKMPRVDGHALRPEAAQPSAAHFEPTG